MKLDPIKEVVPNMQEGEKNQEGDAAVGRDSNSVAKIVYRVVGEPWLTNTQGKNIFDDPWNFLHYFPGTWLFRMFT